MSEHVRAEFTRQAGPMAAAAAFHAASVLERLVNAVGPRPAGRVLDLACGPGIVSEALAPAATVVVGVDATPEMVRLAEARFAGARLANGSFRVALAEALPFAPGEFDAVVTRLSFHHFPDLPAVLAEIRRVLSPHGRLVVADVLASTDPEEAALHNALERLRDPTHVRMLARPALLQALHAAGFEPGFEDTWEQERAFPEWAQIVAEAARTEPLREVMRALARAGRHAGVRLREEAGEIRFTHTWLLVVAQPASEPRV